MSSELGTARSTVVTIKRVEAIPLRIHLTFHRTLSKGAVSSRTDKAWVGNPVLIRLESADGAVGLSQVRPIIPWLGETTDSIVAAIQHYYAPVLLDSNALERELLVRRLERVLPGNSIALAGIDIAVHDLVGKSLGLPVYALLGGARVRIPLDWSISLNAPEAMLAEANKAVKEYGVGIICLKAGPSTRWSQDIAAFKSVRAAVGPDIEIGMDPNEGYDLPTALRVLRALEDENVAYVEQPLERSDLDGLRMLRAQTGVRLLVDESAISLSDAYRVVREGACDGLVLKLWKSGGFTNARRMAALAEAAGVGATVGGVAQGSVLEAAASAHLYASLPAPALAAEFALGLNVIDRDPIARLPEGFNLKDGHTEVPGGPGLGVDIDMGAVKELTLAR